jgi:integrase
MTRSIHRLSDRNVKNAREGLHCDGGGLYLQVTRGTDGLRRSWLFRYAVGGGRERMMGLGPFPAVSLAQARQKAAEARSQRAQGIDPLDAKAAVRASTAMASAKAMTFDQCRDAYAMAHQKEWTPRYAKDWASSVTRYASSLVGRLPPSLIDVTLVMQILEPIWTDMPVLAPLVRQRCESIWSWARARELCKGENPFRWDNLKHLLASPAKIHDVEHFAALPYTEMPGFMAELQAREGTAARALRFCILCAGRSDEVLGAKWPEIDIKARTWVVPAGRMKGREEHRVPLSDAAMRIIEHQGKVRENDYVFPGGRRERLSHAAMDSLLTRMRRSDITVHGTARSAFKDWCAETTNYPDWVSEKALAHKVGDETRRAYQRGDLLERRRQLMSAWGRYCESAPTEQSNVTPIRQAG